MSAKVFVGNLSYYTTESQLADLLAEAGQVVGVVLPADRKADTAVVEFRNQAAARKCVEMFNEHELEGRKLRVRVGGG